MNYKLKQIEQVTSEKLYRYSNSFEHLVLHEYPVLRETQKRTERHIMLATQNLELAKQALYIATSERMKR